MGKELFTIEEQLGYIPKNLGILSKKNNNEDIDIHDDIEQLAAWERFFDYTAKNSKPMNFKTANAILIALDKGAIIPYNP